MTTFTTEDRQSAEGAKFDEIEFNRLAYQYRCWPAFDPLGVSHRYGELIDYVKEHIK